MKYSKGDNWVELQGCADLPMRELDALYSAKASDAFKIAKGVVTNWHVTIKGQEVPVGDIAGLTLRQWIWLKECILEAARDEGLDPEV